MLSQPESAVRLCFGPFEVNAPAAELRKGGVRVKLSGQPFQILVALLAHPGEVVTREQLHAQIWSDGTVVDFEHGLNAAMNKLRRALSDSAETPRYIETVPGRGYRFIGELSVQENPGHQPASDVPAARKPGWGRWRWPGRTDRRTHRASRLRCASA